jgi:hypothetical protein
MINVVKNELMANMPEKKNFDVVAIYQTSFQKKVLEAVLSQHFQNREIALLNLSGSIFQIENGPPLHTNLYGIGQIVKTIRSLRGNLPVMRCNDLIGSYITSYNGFLFPSIIQFKRLHIIDDGIGTPVIIKHPDYWNKTLKLKVKNMFINNLIKRTLKISLSYPSIILPLISSYFTIYPGSGVMDKRLIPVTIDFFVDKIIQKTVVIGQPVLEYQQISHGKFIKIMSGLVKEYGSIIYYLHPREKISFKPVNEAIEYVVLKDILVEDYFKKHGLPDHIFSFVSTTLLNLSVNIPRTKLFYIRLEYELNTCKSITSEYYSILEKNGVKEYL